VGSSGGVAVLQGGRLKVDDAASAAEDQGLGRSAGAGHAPRARNDAFISYSHAGDGRLAPAVQRGLQGLAKPWYRRRALRVFRDDTSLSVTPSLWTSIEEALDASDYFVLLASPSAATSKWVGRELEHWKATKPVERILSVLTDGEWLWDADSGGFDVTRSTAVPASLLSGVFSEEPRHLDLRWARDEAQLTLRHSRFRNAIAELAATIRQTSKDELEAEDLRQHRRALRLAWSAAAVLAGLVVVASVASFIALRKQQEAVAQARIARSRELATSAVSQLTADPQLSLLLAWKAVDVQDTPQAVDALRSALEVSRVRAVVHHGRTLRSAVFSPAGTLLATSGVDGSARLWRSSDGRQVATFHHGAPINSLSFSPDGKLMVSAGDDGTAVVWRVSPARRVATLHQAGAVRNAAFSPGGKLVMTASSDGTIRLWRLRDRAQVGMLRSPGALSFAAFSADGRFAVTLGPRFAPRLWEIIGRRLLRVLPVRYAGTAAFSRDDTLVVVGGGENAIVFRVPSGKQVSFQRTPSVLSDVVSAAFSRDGKTVATANLGGAVLLWKTAQGYDEAYGGDVISLEAPNATTVSFSADGRLLLANGGDGTARVWQSNGQPLATVRQASNVVAAAFAPTDDRFVTVGADGTAVVWTAANPSSGPPVPQGAADFNSETGSLVTSWRGTVRIFKAASGVQRAVFRVPGQRGTFPRFGSTGRLVLTSSADGPAQIWNAATGANVATLPGDASYVWSLAGSDRVVLRVRAGGGTGTNAAAVFDAMTGHRIASVHELREAFVSIAVSPDATRLVTRDEDGGARLLRSKGGALIADLRTGSGVDHVGFSPRGRFAYTSGRRNTRLWAPASGHQLLRLHGSEVAFTPNEDIVLTNAGDRDYLWSTSDGREIAAIGDARNAVFARDGTIVATGGATVRLFRVTDGHPLAVLAPDGGAAHPEAFSSDGRLLLTESESGPARVWDARTGSQVAVLPRYLTGWTHDFRLFIGSDVDGGPKRSYVCYACVPPRRLLDLAKARSPRPLTRNERESYLHEAK
jgi:WD40 repeat protein